MSYNFQFGIVLDALPDLMQGAALSLSIAIVTMAVGIVLAMPLAVGSWDGKGLVTFLSRSWIELARNTPCLAQIYFFFYGLGAFGIFLSPWLAVGIALCFNNAGYLAEIFRGGLKGVNANQMKGARSLGFGPVGAYRYVVFPQVFTNTFSSIGNQFIWALLNTSLGALIGLYDLSGVAMDYQSRTFKTFEFFLAIAVIYFILAKLVLFLANRFKPGGARHAA
ncbi:amino acid ABC transporter permease [Paracoccus sp. pheM1]|uniref:amino acid ABC transporter permease n=1 Tax=Paracoccus sp. pheM1 TaxID=2831675 RepID=UPI001BDB78FF|nr:amino acid ABC transporter permease [Paracoccus sp. pheM1]MBT0781415.1 amino acid ABC transporter permease [Paracoccus sp. pheM1]